MTTPARCRSRRDSGTPITFAASKKRTDAADDYLREHRSPSSRSPASSPRSPASSPRSSAWDWKAPPLWWEGISAQLGDGLTDLIRRRARITSLTFTPAGGHVVTWGRNDFAVVDGPADLVTALKAAKQRGDAIRSVVFTPSGGWAFLVNRNGAYWSGIDRSAAEALRRVAVGREPLSWIAFVGEKLVLGYAANTRVQPGAPAGLFEALRKNQASRSRVDLLTTSSRGWLMVVGGNKAWWDAIPNAMAERLQQLARGRVAIAAAALDARGRWVIVGSE